MLTTTSFGVLSVALGISIPLVLVDAIILPMLALKTLKISYRKFFIGTWKLPLIINTFLLLFYFFISDIEDIYIALITAVTVSAVYLVITYWIWIFPDKIKSKVSNIIFTRN